MQGEPDAMVGDPRLREVIRADPLAPLAGSNLALAVGGDRGLPFFLRRSSSRALSTRIAFARFLICERSSWQVTTRPVGRCVIRTAESVVLTPWPPGPDER